MRRTVNLRRLTATIVAALMTTTTVACDKLLDVDNPAAVPIEELDNPALMQLRLLQVVGEQSGNTVVLGMPSGATTLPIGGARPRIEGSEPDASE